MNVKYNLCDVIRYKFTVYLKITCTKDLSHTKHSIKMPIRPMNSSIELPCSRSFLKVFIDSNYMSLMFMRSIVSTSMIQG